MFLGGYLGHLLGKYSLFEDLVIFRGIFRGIFFGIYLKAICTFRVLFGGGRHGAFLLVLVWCWFGCGMVEREDKNKED